jgi:outer membrane protein
LKFGTWIEVELNLELNMKRFLNMTICAAVLCGAFGAYGQAAKVGVVDLRKVFDNYYKTKQADSNLKDEAGDMEKQRKEMIDKLKEGEDDYKKLLDKANDQAVSSDERDKSKSGAEKKLLELREQEQMIQQFNRQAAEKLSSKQKRMREKILAEIREVINTKAKAGGYSLVVDTAADSVNSTPVFLYASPDSPSLTEGVLNELNASAPAAKDTK